MVDLLDDELDVVFFFSYVEHQSKSFCFKQKEFYSADVFIRKISYENEFLMFLENVHYEGNLNGEEQELKDIDLKAMRLPITVTPDDIYDFKLDKIIATDNDTEKSFLLKVSVLSLLRIDFSVFDSELVKSKCYECKTIEMYTTVLGECECTLELQNTENYVKVTIASTRSKCKGPVNFNLTKIKNPSPNSTFNRTFYFDLDRNYAGSEMVFDIEDADDSSITYFQRLNIKFFDYKIREKHFQITNPYKPAHRTCKFLKKPSTIY